MLIYVSIVIIMSILYFLLYNFSNRWNLGLGNLIIVILCLTTGVEFWNEVISSVISFTVIALGINWWVVHHNRTKLIPTTRMMRFNYHRRFRQNDLIRLKSQINGFKFKSILKNSLTFPHEFLRTETNQLKKSDQLIKQNSRYQNVDQLIRITLNLKTIIDAINYHLDLTLQLIYPRGLKKFNKQLWVIIAKYRSELSHQLMIHQIGQKIKKTGSAVILNNVNLKRQSIPLIVINQRGIFIINPIQPTNQRDWAKLIKHDQTNQQIIQRLTTSVPIKPRSLWVIPLSNYDLSVKAPVSIIKLNQIKNSPIFKGPKIISRTQLRQLIKRTQRFQIKGGLVNRPELNDPNFANLKALLKYLKRLNQIDQRIHKSDSSKITTGK